MQLYNSGLDTTRICYFIYLIIQEFNEKSVFEFIIGEDFVNSLQLQCRWSMKTALEVMPGLVPF